MKYYLNTIEQTFTEEEGVKTYNEYAKVEKVEDFSTALSKYYTKLANVAADIGKAHSYMYINIVTSTGVKVKEEVIGSYVETPVDGD